MAAMRARRSRNQGSMPVSAAMAAGARSRRRAAIRAHRRVSVADRSMAPSPRQAGSSQRSVRRPNSSERTAFVSAPSKVRSMAITSPVAFICVPSWRSPSANLSNGQRGIFTTQ